MVTNPVGFFLKDPDAVLNYSIDWSNWLNEGDTVSASEWFADSDLSVETSLFQPSGVTTVVLSGGEHGRQYTVTNRITTAGGLVNDGSIVIRVRHQ